MSKLEIKVTILGEGAVGKTCLCLRYTSNQFLETYNPTIEEQYQRNFKIGQAFGKVDILDTAGEEDYKGLSSQWINFGDGFVVLYSIDNSNSFLRAKDFVNMIRAHKGDAPIILVGNKSDLDFKREVSTDEAMNYSQDNNLQFIEASAKENKNCTQLFEDLLKAIFLWKRIDIEVVEKTIWNKALDKLCWFLNRN